MTENDLLNWAVMIGLTVGAIFSYVFIPFGAQQPLYDRITSMGTDLNNRREALKLLIKPLEDEFSGLHKKVEDQFFVSGIEVAKLE